MYLDDLYVREAYRKQSVGKKLLDEVIGLALREQCKKLRWQVSGWNSNAIAFYEKMGAMIDRTEINCDLVLPPQ
jgi:diamine N-acetyltransferase